MDDYSGWQPGQHGKGFIGPGGFIQHWVTDTAGNPHHMMMAGEDENPDFYKRFDVMPDGRVIDIVDHLDQRFDHGDWQKVLDSHPDFYAAEEAAEQGFGHADSILDSLHRREAMEDIERSMQWAVERYGSSSTRKLIEQAESLPPDRTEILHDLGDGWKIVKPTTFGDIHRTGELMGNCWSMNEGEFYYDHMLERSPELKAKAEKVGPFMRDYNRYRESDPQRAAQAQRQLRALDHEINQEMQRHMHMPITDLDPPERMLHDPYGIPRVVWYGDHKPVEILGRHNSVPKKQYWDKLEQAYPGITPAVGACHQCGTRTPEAEAKYRETFRDSYMGPESIEEDLANPNFCPTCHENNVYTGR